MEALLVIAVFVFIMLFYFFKKNTRSKESNNIEIKNDGAIRFYVDQASPEEIKHCELGDSVKLWMPSVDPRRITIYREGTHMGAGKIGYVPDEHFEKIAPYVENDTAFTTRVIEKEESSCKIEYLKKTTEETFSEMSSLIDQLEKAQENLREELSKKYTPRKPIEVQLFISGEIKVRTGEKLKIEFEELEFYVGQESPTIEFKNSENKVIGSLSGTHEVVRILKANFNGYQFNIEVLNSPSTHTKYRDPIRIFIKPFKTQY